MSLAPDFKMEKEAAKQLETKRDLLKKGHQGYFNTPDKKSKETTLDKTMYDRQMHVEELQSSSKLHRDDRQSRVGLDVNKEEQARPVRVLASSVYGSRQPIDTLAKSPHGRKKVVQQEFYSKGISNLS